MTYRKGKSDFTAVDRLSMSFNAGEITSVLGPNGAGKTSTIEACEGFRRPRSGRIEVFGLDPRKDAPQLRPRVGVMLQDGGAWLGVRTGELLRYMAGLYANPLNPDELLDRLGLQEHSKTTFRRLSGGQRQRLCLAMAIVGRPELVFLDEPTAGMDPHARQGTWELVRQLRAGGTAVVLTTHHMDEAQALSDQVYIMNKGTLAASGTPAQLVEQAGNQCLIVEVRGSLDTRVLMNDIPALRTVEDLGEGRYRFGAQASTDLMALLANWCDQHTVELRAIRAEESSLEQRFLEITKREAS